MKAEKHSSQPAKPKLDRRVGGLAPNGNPQCWFAPHEAETDTHRLAQRSKQIEYGKKSAGYQAYLQKVPKCASTHAWIGLFEQCPQCASECLPWMCY